MSTRLHSVLRVQQDGSMVIVQPWEDDKVRKILPLGSRA